MRGIDQHAVKRLAWAGAFGLSWILSTWAFVALDGLGPTTHGGMTHGETVLTAVCIAVVGAIGLGTIAPRNWPGIAFSGAIPPALLFFVVLDSAATGGGSTVMSWPLFAVGIMLAFALGARLGGRLWERIGAGDRSR